MNASSSGITEAGAPSAAGAVAHTGVSVWIRKKLDSFLREDQRRARPDELNRYRIVTVGALSQLVMSVFYLGSVLTTQNANRRFMLGVAILCVVFYALTLVVVRRSHSPLYPGLMLCSVLASAYIGAGMYLGNRMAATHVASTLIPLMAFFLLGSRGGLAFTLLMALYAVILQPLAQAKFDLWNPSFSGGLAVSANTFAALCIVGVWGLSYMNSRARDKAQQQLEQTLKSLRENERKLSSLLESTDDIVCSLDAEGRLLTSNAAYAGGSCVPSGRSRAWASESAPPASRSATRTTPGSSPGRSGASACGPRSSTRGRRERHDGVLPHPHRRRAGASWRG